MKNDIKLPDIKTLPFSNNMVFIGTAGIAGPTAFQLRYLPLLKNKFDLGIILSCEHFGNLISNLYNELFGDKIKVIRYEPEKEIDFSKYINQNIFIVLEFSMTEKTRLRLIPINTIDLQNIVNIYSKLNAFIYIDDDGILNQTNPEIFKNVYVHSFSLDNMKETFGEHWRQHFDEVITINEKNQIVHIDY